jgi:dTMP kinase
VTKSLVHLRGKLIAIEGIDQAGKQTIAGRLATALREQGIEVQQIGFPDYSTPLGREIGEYLAGNRDFTPECRQLLYAANRWELAPRIREWLARGTTVISDRYIASGLAYGAAQGLDPEWIEHIERGLPPADITILLEIAPTESLARKRGNRDAYERRLDLLQMASTTYATLAQQPNWVRVDAGADRDAVWQRVLRAIVTNR